MMLRNNTLVYIKDQYFRINKQFPIILYFVHYIEVRAYYTVGIHIYNKFNV